MDESISALEAQLAEAKQEADRCWRKLNNYEYGSDSHWLDDKLELANRRAAAISVKLEEARTGWRSNRPGANGVHLLLCHGRDHRGASARGGRVDLSGLRCAPRSLIWSAVRATAPPPRCE